MGLSEIKKRLRVICKQRYVNRVWKFEDFFVKYKWIWRKQVICKKMDHKTVHNAGIFFITYFKLHIFFIFPRPWSTTIWKGFTNFKIFWTQGVKELNFFPSHYVKLFWSQNSDNWQKKNISHFINLHVAIEFVWKIKFLLKHPEMTKKL